MGHRESPHKFDQLKQQESLWINLRDSQASLEPPVYDDAGNLISGSKNYTYARKQ